jgi:CheY-like chemotaxis protein
VVKGSEFIVRLPLARTSQESKPKVQGGVHATRKGYRILIADDNVDTASGMERLLKLLGNDAMAVHDGSGAVLAARTFRPDFVLLDIGLPGMDGYEVAAMLRGDEVLKDAVIIAVSGYGREEDRQRALSAGFDHHLVKPVDFDALTSLLGRPDSGEG